MTRQEFVLLALAGADGQSFTPVQVQKLLFILDRNIGAVVNGSGFNFQPYHYGPFDKAVYTTLEALETEGKVEIVTSDGARRLFRLTEQGQDAGEQLLSHMGDDSRAYISAVCDFVRSQSFAGLVSSIYKAYPEMKVNSVFKFAG